MQFNKGQTHSLEHDKPASESFVMFIRISSNGGKKQLVESYRQHTSPITHICTHNFSPVPVQICCTDNICRCEKVKAECNLHNLSENKLPFFPNKISTLCLKRSIFRSVYLSKRNSGSSHFLCILLKVLLMNCDRVAASSF